jgi:hypothetical protein
MQLVDVLKASSRGLAFCYIHINPADLYILQPINKGSDKPN